MLKEDILTLKLKPGQMISENEIASTYNVSRTPIKTAFMRLKGENYIDIVPQRGTFVTPMDLKYIKDAIYMRSVLETDILESIMTSDDAQNIISMLEDNLNQQQVMIDSGDAKPKAFFGLDNNFHQISFEAVGRIEMWNIIQYCQVFYTRFRMLDSLATSRYKQLCLEHELILQAIKSKDKAKLKTAVFDHLHGALYLLSDKIENEYRGYFIQ